MNISAWKNGGAGVVIYWTISQTSFGDMLIAATERGICRLSFNEDEQALTSRFPKAQLKAAQGSFETLFDDVTAAIESGQGQEQIPLDVGGTDFQQAVWQQLRQIPRGETRSYGDIAAAVGKPKAVRAAGSANGANNVAVLIPCHRVVRSDGSLGGYAYGLKIKEKLLRHEAVGSLQAKRI